MYERYPHEYADLQGLKLHRFLVSPSFRWHLPHVVRITAVSYSEFCCEVNRILLSQLASSYFLVFNKRWIASTALCLFFAYLSKGNIIVRCCSASSSSSDSSNKGVGVGKEIDRFARNDRPVFNTCRSAKDIVSTCLFHT